MIWIEQFKPCLTYFKRRYNRLLLRGRYVRLPGVGETSVCCSVPAATPVAAEPLAAQLARALTAPTINNVWYGCFSLEKKLMCTS